MTVHFYLPPDRSMTHVGTKFLHPVGDQQWTTASQMEFAPNTGYAFAVGEDTWHSADQIGPEISTRDSILLTYFVDSKMIQILRNRAKRVGNFVRNEVKHITAGPR